MQPHDRYRRIEDDLITEVPISIAQAALGTKVELSTLDGDEELTVQAGTQPGHEFVLRGRGVPRLHGRGRGDLRAIVRVEVPNKLSAAEVDLLRQYAELRGESVELTRRTAEETVAPVQVLVPAVAPVDLDGGPMVPGVPDADPAVESLARIPEAASAGLEPVAESAKRAVFLFLRDTGLAAAEPTS